VTALIVDARLSAPDIVAAAGARASYRFLEFFTAKASIGCSAARVG
jgi:hypothetical protein